MTSDRRHLLLDSPSLIYRAYFALPNSIRGPHGRPTNAVHGYLDMVATLVRERHPASVTHCFDLDWRPAWRVAAYAGYKSKRAEDPPDLPWQFEVILAVLDAAGMPVATAAEHEADDVIGTLATRATAEQPAEIVTGDRDLLQLVRDPAVRLLFTVRGVRNLAVFDEAAVLARYGVPPALYAEFAMLRGDPSDGLPGLPGVGEKGAARLLGEHGSLEALVAAADRLPPRLAAALREGAAYLAAMRTVVPVATAVEVDVTTPHAPDAARLEALAEEHRIGGPVGRLRHALAESPFAALSTPYS